MREQHQVSYRELIEQAGISRGALRKAIHQAIRGNLLQCVRAGRASQAGIDAESSIFELKWHAGSYSSDPGMFRVSSKAPATAPTSPTSSSLGCWRTSPYPY